MVEFRRPAGIDQTDVMLLKGVALGKTYRQMRADILCRSVNTVKERMERLRRDGYVRYERYDRERRLTDKGRDLLKSALG
jgi:Mn-dependent DtxR family transcriptional regulator